MRELLVKDDSILQFGVTNIAANFCFYLDKVKIDVAALDVCHTQHSVYTNCSQLFLLLVNYFRAKRSDSCTDQFFTLGNVYFLTLLLNCLDADVACFLVASGDV